MPDFVWLWLILAIIFILALAYILRAPRKRVRFVQQYGVALFVIERHKINLFLNEYRVYKTFTYKQFDRCATKMIFWTAKEAVAWVKAMRGSKGLIVHRSLGDVLLATSEAKGMSVIENEHWNRVNTIRIADVPEGALVNERAHPFFKALYGKKAITGNRLIHPTF